MNTRLSIRSWCTIKGRSAYSNNTLLYAAETPDCADFLVALYRHLGTDYPKFYKMDQLSKLGWLASEFLLQTQPMPPHIAPEAVGLVVMNAHSSLDTDRKYLDSVRTVASPGLFVYTLPNILLGEICIRRGLKGENAFFIFPEFDAAFLQEYVTALFAAADFQACICGWVDLLGEEIDAALFLVTRDPGPLAFTAEQLDIVYSKTF